MRKRTNSEYKLLLKDRNENLEMLSEYTGNHDKVTVKCLICGNVFSSDASSLLSGHGCPVCARKKAHDSQARTHEQFESELKNISPNILIKSRYYNSSTYVDVKCSICGNEYKALPSNLLNGNNCRRCYLNSKFRSKHELISMVAELNPSIIVGDDFIDGKKHCTFTCIICGYSHKVYPNNFLSTGCRCPKCDGNVPISSDEYKEYIHDKNNALEVISDYTNCKENVSYKCNNCGSVWDESPDTIKARSFRCKVCERISSKSEKLISNYLNSKGIQFIPQYKFDELVGVGNRKLSYDFYIPSKNLLIEYNGEQHYRPVDYFGGEDNFEIQMKHDRLKEEYALNNGYDLLIIPYYHNESIYEILDEKIKTDF